MADRSLDLLDSLVQLSFSVQDAMARVSAQHELSITQMRLLGILRDRQPAMLDVATVLNLDKSSVTGLVDRAERRGLVRRTSSPTDGRAVILVLTERGRSLSQKVVKAVEREISQLAESLSEAGRKRLRALATEIVRHDHALRFSDLRVT